MEHKGSNGNASSFSFFAKQLKSLAPDSAFSDSSSGLSCLPVFSYVLIPKHQRNTGGAQGFILAFHSISLLSSIASQIP
jgi:hypothetical protein